MEKRAAWSLDKEPVQLARGQQYTRSLIVALVLLIVSLLLIGTWIGHRTQSRREASGGHGIQGHLAHALDGKPVIGARVTAKLMHRLGPPTGTAGQYLATTDSSGRYILPPLASGWWRIRATAPGLGAEDRTIEAVGQATWPTMDFLMVSTGSVTGRVTEEGTDGPVEGFFLQAHSGHRELTTYTDEQGQYRLDGLFPGQAMILLDAGWSDCYPHDMKQLILVAVEPGAVVEELDFHARPGRAAHGRVVDPAGRPVAGAKVAHDHSAAIIDDIEPTAKDGTFRIGGLWIQPEVTFHARADGFLPAEKTVKTPESRDPVDAGDIVLTRACQISGRVVDTDGRPVAGIGMFVEQPGKRRFSSRSTIRTDESGMFTFRGIEKNRVEIRAIVPCRQGDVIGPVVECAPEMTVSDVEFPVPHPDGEELALRIVDGSGQPISGAAVRISPAGGEGDHAPSPGVTSYKEVECSSTPDGVARFVNLTGNSYYYLAEHRDFAPQGRGPVSPGTKVANISMHANGTASGRVATEDGALPEHFRIKACRGSGESVKCCVEDCPCYSWRSRPEKLFGAANGGGFEISGLLPGENTLVAEVRGYLRGLAVVDVPAGDTAEAGAIRLERGAFIRGRVVRTDGAGVEHATVRFAEGTWRRYGMDFDAVSLHDIPGLFLSSGPDGEFMASGLQPGSYLVQARGTGRLPSEVQALEIPVNGEVALPDLILPESGVVSGHLRQNGEPVPGIEIRLYSSNKFLDEVETDDSGAFSFSESPTGRSILHAITHSRPFAFMPVDVDAQQTTVQDIDLDQLGTISLRIRDRRKFQKQLWMYLKLPATAPWSEFDSDAPLTERPILAGVITAEVYRGGEVDLARLPEGQYLLEIATREEQPEGSAGRYRYSTLVWQPVEVRARENNNVELTIQPGQLQ